MKPPGKYKGSDCNPPARDSARLRYPRYTMQLAGTAREGRTADHRAIAPILGLALRIMYVLCI